MLKRFTFALLVLAVMSGASFGVTVNDYSYVMNQDRIDNNYTNYIYLQALYNEDIGVNYQLRELTGNNTAGPQWFATVYENYYYTLLNTRGNNDDIRIYRRTMGGEIPEITISAVGNIVGGFNFTLLEEPQPYPVNVFYYDTYPDPMESLCLVIKNGNGNFNINFGNPYASHYPYWWHWSTTPNSNIWSERSRVASINEPIAYMINTSSGVIAELGTDRNYTNKYTITLSTDLNASGDAIISYHYEINDMDGNLVYITSGDAVIDVNNNNSVVYTVPDVNISGLNIHSLTTAVPDDTKIYNASGTLVYTLESEVINNVRYVYVCDVRSVTESVRIDGLDNYYTFTFNPRYEQTVNPGEYYSANVRVNSPYGATDYGSALGYITFNQKADLWTGYSRYREDTTIPMVIANVYDGNAADVPLQFDMTVYDSDTVQTADHVINRVKFTWDAQEDMPTQDFGTFFMIRPEGEAMPTYYLRTQITNRTGTRYRLYRYDFGGTTTFGNTYPEIYPMYWKYDLPLSPTELQRYTLPQYFNLDAHSQIAPGLVTVYNNSVYGTMNTAYDTYESFMLGEYDSPNPKSLRLNYKRIGGMNLIEDGTETLSGVRTREFIMQFADVIQDENETAYQLENLMGRPPVMTTASFKASASTKSKNDKPHTTSVNINSSAIDAFRFLKLVPDGLITFITVSDDESDDEPAEASSLRASATKEVSADIAIQPLSIRMRVPRQSSLIVDHWTEFENAATSTALFNAFARYGTVWLRSDSTAEKDRNLFTAMNDAGNRVSASAPDFVNAFIYDDELFLDFIVVLADAASPTSGKSAYVRAFRDDNIPYILIGDGNENGQWDMTFYISAAGEDPTTRNDNPSNEDPKPANNNSGGGGGGGCSLGLFGMLGALVLVRKIKR